MLISCSLYFTYLPLTPSPPNISILDGDMTRTITSRGCWLFLFPNIRKISHPLNRKMRKIKWVYLASSETTHWLLHPGSGTWVVCGLLCVLSVHNLRHTTPANGVVLNMVSEWTNECYQGRERWGSEQGGQWRLTIDVQGGGGRVCRYVTMSHVRQTLVMERRHAVMCFVSPFEHNLRPAERMPNTYLSSIKLG